MTPQELDAKIASLIQLYFDSGMRLLDLMRTLEDGVQRRRVEQLILQIEGGINSLTAQASSQMAEILGLAYRLGADEMVRSLTAQGITGVDNSLRSIIHQRAVQAIMDDAFYSILEASNNMSQDAKDRIRDIVRTANQRSLLEGVSKREATRQAVAAATETGIRGIVTANGANIPVDKYMAGVVHYHQRKAHVTGAEELAKETGIDLVYVNYVGITCEYCAVYQGRVYSISGRDPRFPKLEVRPPYHSHCVHSLSAYVEEYHTAEETQQMVEQSNRPFTDNRTERNIRAYERRQREKSRKNATMKQWMRYKAVLPNDIPDLRTFASQKARNTTKYKEWQGLYKAANEQIKLQDPLQNANQFAFQNFNDISRGVDLTDRQKLAEGLLKNAGLENIPVFIENDIGVNGYCSLVIVDGKMQVTKYYLLKNDARPAYYRTKTALHEFYHANMNGLPTDYDVLGYHEWIRFEEVATETAAHYMAGMLGINEEMAFSYSSYLVDILPRLKQLDEFKNATKVKDFGEYFMKYRFDDDFKSAKWGDLKSRYDKISVDYNEYYEQYRDYVEKNKDDIAKMVFDNISDEAKNSSPDRYLQVITESIDRGWASLDAREPGFTDSLIIAMNRMGVK